MALEKDLKVGKEYWLDEDKINYGVFHSFDEDNRPYFKAIVNKNYLPHSVTGLIGFTPSPECKWEEKKSFPTKTVIAVVVVVLSLIGVLATQI
jgi:hypothetical protein